MTTNASEEVGAAMPARPPKENLVRATNDIELVRSDDTTMPTLTGHFAVWNQWTEIRSAWEGNFLERFSPESMSRSLQNSTPKVLFNHGKDPMVGEKPLGIPERVQPDADGAFYSVPLFDTSYNHDLIPGLDAGAFGASFRFSVLREDVVQRPKKSDYNPRGLPERTVQEARIMEFGPVTFPAYAGATAGLRSMTDEFLIATLRADEDLSQRTGISLAGVKTPFERADATDIWCLSQMLNMGAQYLADQDETDDASDIKAMTGVLHTLTNLIDGEIDETEPDEPTGAEMLYGEDEHGEARATWSTAEIDDLPDSSFLYVESGGEKDAEGKTKPRSLRHFPYKDASGSVDLPHLRDALARIPDSDLSDSVKTELTSKAEKILQNNRASDSDPSGDTTRGDSEASVPTTRSTDRGLFWFTEPPKL